MTVQHGGLSIDWLGYATVRIETPGGVVVYLDPGRYGVLDDYDARDGDLVCVTHNHHYDPDGVERVAAPDATVVAYEGVDASIIDRDVRSVDELPYEVVRTTDGETRTIAGVDLTTVPAYNYPDGDHCRNGEPVHPRGFGCGYHLTLDGTAGAVTAFWPGDSDVIDEHEGLDVSLFLANIGGTVVMDRHEAADLAAALAPDLVLPVHYNTIEILETDPRAFAADVAARGVPVVLEQPAGH